MNPRVRFQVREFLSDTWRITLFRLERWCYNSKFVLPWYDIVKYWLKRVVKLLQLSKLSTVRIQLVQADAAFDVPFLTELVQLDLYLA
jgi:hypothetical protein